MKKYKYKGTEYSVKELSDLSGITPAVIYSRIKMWGKDNIEKVIESPVEKKVGRYSKEKIENDIATNSQSVSKMTKKQRKTLKEFDRMANKGRWI